MAKQRSYDTRGKQKKNPLHCGTITQQDILLMERARRRQDQIDSGIPTNAGCGIHGGGKRQRNRKDRAEGHQAIKNRDWD